MPFKYVKPEVFMTYGKKKIYYTYQDEQFNDRSEYWYTTDVHEDEEFQFDIRTLETKVGAGLTQREIIRWAIDKNLIQFSPNTQF